MTTQTQIRQAFTRDLDLLAEAGLDCWLIKGDFDRFKMINDLYGCLITDYILDWSIEAIESTLARYERRLGTGKILWNVIGDDVTIYLAPSCLREDDLLWLLQDVRSAVRESFFRRYAVAALPFPTDFFTGVPPHALAALKSELEQGDIVIDFSPRHQGCLVLLPIGSGCDGETALAGVLASIEKCLRRPCLALSAQWHWLYHPGHGLQAIFNDGFVYPPSISFAACSARREIGDALFEGMLRTEKERQPYFEKLSAACQMTLKACKQQRCGVLLGQNLCHDTAQSESEQAADGSDACSRLRWASERCLREALYCKSLDQAMLFQINPVYRFASGAHQAYFQLEEYRGNEHGVGLKGVNELCGQSVANGVIRRLIVCFAELLSSALQARQMPFDRLQTALFVDRFSVFCERAACTLPDVIRLGQQLIASFNHASQEIKISHLRVSVVQSSQALMGYALLHRLALTQLSRRTSAIVYADTQMEVRQFCQAAADDGQRVLESNAFDAAYHLAAASQAKNVNVSKRSTRPVCANEVF